jgi:Tfp pilus assembly protein PilO
MAELKDIKIPKRGIVYVMVGLIFLLVFVLAVVYPMNNWSKNLDSRTAETKFKLQEQQTLLPVYQYLKVESEKKLAATLPMPPKSPLPRARINTLPGSIAISAKRSGMSLVSAKPDLTGLTGTFQTLPVNIVLRGKFVDFRKFLIALGGMPHVQRIEEIAIQEAPDTKEFKLKVWVAIG